MSVYASEIVLKARAELGTEETPIGSNNVKYNTWYNNGVPLRQEWCCCFVCWVFNHVSGAKHLFYNGGKTAYVPTLMNWARTIGRYIPAESTVLPHPGDVIFFDWNNNAVSDHVGLIEKVSGTQVTTIEGNYRDMVARRQYDATTYNYALGYYRPNYLGAGEIPEQPPYPPDSPYPDPDPGVEPETPDQRNKTFKIFMALKRRKI